jgi:hypothetical protein
MLDRSLAGTLVTLVACGCAEAGGRSEALPELSKQRRGEPAELAMGRYWPEQKESEAVGPLTSRITRDSDAFARLVRSEHPAIVFKDEEGTGADRLMTPRLRASLHALGELVESAWPNVKLRVTEAWDEGGEHGPNSLHYQGRAADLTLSDLDSGKLGRLTALARRAGFGWVYYESSTHVHVSVAD